MKNQNFGVGDGCGNPFLTDDKRQGSYLERGDRVFNKREKT